jgi:hypothetical protein
MSTKPNHVRIINDARCNCGDFCILNSDLDEAEARIEKLEIALRKIVICDWPGPYPQPIIRNRAEWMQDIAKEALK